jgi:hypothetical protein
LIDPTPHIDKESSVVFVKEDLPYHGKPIPSVYLQTDGSAETTKFLEVNHEFQAVNLAMMARKSLQPTASELAVMKRWASVVTEVFPKEAASMFRNRPS